METTKIGMLGAGNMAGALIRGMLASQRVAPEQIRASDLREERLSELEAEYADGSGYARFKEDAGSAVSEYLGPIRERYEAIRPDETQLESVLREGAEKARAISSKTVEIAADRMGLGPGSGGA